MTAPYRALSATERKQHRVCGLFAAMTAVLGLLTALMLVCDAEVVLGDSMVPAIYEGDAVVVNRVSYLLGNPQRGDVVIVTGLVDDVAIIKRITGVPGDVVESLDGRFFLEAGMYFVEGDAGCSVDSKHLGPVGRNQIKGKVSLVFQRNEQKSCAAN